MLESRSAISSIISSEVDNGIPASRIVVGGFSQGGTMSLLTGLTGDTKLGGIAVLSGRLPMRDKFKSVRLFKVGFMTKCRLTPIPFHR